MTHTCFHFDTLIDRHKTFCTQWDYMQDRFGAQGLLPFAISDMDFASPEPLLTSLQQRLSHGVFGYTRWNHRDFKQAIVDWYQTQFQAKVEPDTLVYSPSVLYTIAKLLAVVSDVGDHVVVQTPAYDAFFNTITANHRVVSANPLLRDAQGQFTLDLADLDKRLAHPRAKVLLLCHPHNPTGRVWRISELKQILTLCQAHGVYVISDEIHMDIRRAGQPFQSLIQQDTDLAQLCVCTSASKTFNTPGLGGSYAIIPDVSIREPFLAQLKTADGLSSASVFGLTALMAGYTQCSDWLNALNLYLDDNLRTLQAFYAQHYPSITFAMPEATYFAWVDTEPLGYDMATLQQALVSVGKVGVMAGSTYDVGPASATYLRWNVACPHNKLAAGLTGFQQAITHLQTST